jgi:preprotein translocase subunit SecG
MKIVDLYGWGLPKQADFLNHFKNNGAMYNQARSLWSKLDQTTVWFLVAFIVLALIFAFVYYGPYNNKPHRHYKVKHWLIWMFITAAATFVVSLVIGLVMVQSPLAARIGLILRISGLNALYSVGLYFIFALLVCNMPFLKTNAYRFLKIGK